MRIGVYLTQLNPAYAGGLTTYAFGLVNGLLQNQRGHEVVLFGDETVLRDRLNQPPHASFVPIEAPPRGLAELIGALPGLAELHVAVRNRRMRQVAARVSAACDVVLFPLSVMATYRLGIPSIVSFHDLQHETFPEFFDWRTLRARRVLYGATFRHATLIQASSTAMKEEALRVYGDRLRPERIAVIPEGVDYAAFSEPALEDPRALYALPQEFILYPAQLWRHKNHLRLLQALHRIRCEAEASIPLVLTGAEFEAAPAIRAFIREHAMSAQVFILGKVPYPHLKALYKQATYVLSASLHESNCLPVLEAAASGSPLIVADIPANRESAQVFKLRMFDPFDVASIAATLMEAWRSRDGNGPAVESNRQAVRRFDWSCIADMYIDQAERLCAGGPA